MHRLIRWINSTLLGTTVILATTMVMSHRPTSGADNQSCPNSIYELMSCPTGSYQRKGELYDRCAMQPGMKCCEYKAYDVICVNQQGQQVATSGWAADLIFSFTPAACPNVKGLCQPPPAA